MGTRTLGCHQIPIFCSLGKDLVWKLTVGFKKTLRKELFWGQTGCLSRDHQLQGKERWP